MFSVRVSKKKEGGGAFYFLFFIFKMVANGVPVVENSTSKRLENISERHLSIQNATSIPRLYYLLLCSNQCTHKHHFLAFLILPNKPKKNTSAARRRAVKSTCACVVFVNYRTLNWKSSQTEFSCR